ncbi:MAG: sensor domain-containing protein [Jatrophihabitans sp.]
MNTATRADVAAEAVPVQFGNPLSLLVSPLLWSSVGYLVAYLLLGALWFAATLTALLAGGITSIFVIGLPILAAGLAVIRVLASVERIRVPQPLGGPIASPYLPARTGFRADLAGRVQDPATWRDVVLLLILWPVLFILDVIALVVWLIGWGLISLPFWYQYPPQTFNNGVKAHGTQIGYYKHGPHQGPHYGWFIDDLRSSLIAAGVGALVVLVVGNYLLVGVAKLHASITRGLLGPSQPSTLGAVLLEQAAADDRLLDLRRALADE